jgi:hypothetical protein
VSHKSFHDGAQLAKVLNVPVREMQDLAHNSSGEFFPRRVTVPFERINIHAVVDFHERWRFGIITVKPDAEFEAAILPPNGAPVGMKVAPHIIANFPGRLLREAVF